MLDLLKAGFEFGQGLAGQGAGTDVGNERFPDMRHGVVRGIEIIEPAPVFVRDEVRRERVQQLEIVLNRNRHARPVRASRPILQCRKDELLAEPFQQPADEVAVRAQVARREDLFFEDVVWREEAHSVFGGIVRLKRNGDIQFRAMALGVGF